MQSASWMDINWRAHQRWVQVAGGPLNVIDVGDGPAVLFVHGLGGCWQNWLEQLPVFGERYRAIAPDLPGFGYSPMPMHAVSIANYVRAAREMLDALGIERVALVGNSMGGLIAAELALTVPDRVARLAVISPAGIALELRRAQLVALRFAQPLVSHAGRQLARNADTLAKRPRTRRLLLGPVAHRPRLIAPALAAEQLRGMGKPALFPALEDLLKHSISDRLATIACPTLIIWGENDRVLPVRHAELYGAIPGARKVIYPDTAHVAMFERPDEVNALLEEHLSGGAHGTSQPGSIRARAPGALFAKEQGPPISA